MALNLKSSGGGSVTVDVPSTASNYTATLPAANITVVGTSSAVSSAGQIPFSTDGSTFTPTAKIVSGTAVASTSGTSIDFTGIPSWVKRITVQINGLSYAAAGVGVIQIGAGSLTTTGYTAYTNLLSTTPAFSASTVTNGFGNLSTSAAATTLMGQYVLTNMGSNTWVCSGQNQRAGDGGIQFINGSITLSGALDRLSIVATTSTFDAGSINILYE